MNRKEELNPLDHPVRWERLVGSIVEAGEPYLAERRSRIDLATTLVRWGRPALSAAAAVLLLLAGTVGFLGGADEGGGNVPTLAATVVPEAWAAWLVADYEPTIPELITALEEVP